MDDYCEMYLGHSKEKQAEYEEYLKQQYGKKAEHHIAESKERTKDWGAVECEQAKQAGEQLNRDFAAALEAQQSADSAEVQQLVKRHYKWILQFWTPDQQAYIDLGKLYAEHPDFREYYGKCHPQLADFLAEAMKVFAERELM